MLGGWYNPEKLEHFPKKCHTLFHRKVLQLTDLTQLLVEEISHHRDKLAIDWKNKQCRTNAI
jgi:hypothetical protein